MASVEAVARRVTIRESNSDSTEKNVYAPKRLHALLNRRGDLHSGAFFMAHAQPNPVLRYVRRVAGAAVAGNVTDAELLARFIASRDEAAFELLLWRHG